MQDRNAMRGSPEWTSAFAAAMGDGIVPRPVTGAIPTTPAPKRSWWRRTEKPVPQEPAA